MPPKSILKKTQSPNLQGDIVHTSRAESTDVSSKQREVAVHHAQLLQQRKNVEAANLSAIEELMDFPSDSSAGAAHPSSSDMVRFKHLVQSFQPSDYNELLQERNCIDKCGYVFCPRTRRIEPGRGSVRLQAGGRDNTKFLSAKQVEMWCSDACARRALYIKVQLSEQPAWERSGGFTSPIELLDQYGQEALESKVGQHTVGDADDDAALAKAVEELALERGEQKDSRKPTAVMRETVNERTRAT